ncbi:beta-microseminoprotein-like [Pseudochaenichthys georgianus]|uniref:beta-microseminoprotein-like n=1 Tax=Pseudochaenichthys georgianus TaxID=52239 RepID=UPI00146DF3FE|nr:beta-microseminoprotein-like isoform X2 [Pseudochaenichthys georgianus]XP_033947437.1 beta-microseminoprotein-like isoform X2 [Pseudochaenichthys georgianus]
MEKYLALALLFCALASLSDAQCQTKALQPNMTHCQDDSDHTWHPVGSLWRNSECLDCSCTGCCQAYITPTEVPEDCVAVLDTQACEYIVHTKGNSNGLCEGVKIWKMSAV